MRGATESSFHHSRSRRISPARGRRYAFAFVCQRGDLEIKAVLLAASLKRYLQCRHELVACLHAPDIWGRPDPSTLAFFERMGIRTAIVQNVADAAFVNAIKISCLRVDAHAEKIVFLDSDMLCMAPFHDDPRFCVPVNVKPADLPSFSREEKDWRAVYGAAGLALPERRMRATLSQEEMPPLFHGGFIAVNRGTELADAWQDVALKLRADPALRDVVGLSDQPSLTVAVHAIAATYDLLNERYAYPLHMRPMKDHPPPLFCHYHGPRIIRREPQVNRLVQELASEHAEIASLISASEDWAPLLRPYAVRPRRRWWPVSGPDSFEGPELILAEIPGSGGEVLCRLLGGYANTLIVDQPPDVMESLRVDSVPWRAAVYLREARRRVLDHAPVTSPAPGQAQSIPRVQAADFILGVNIGGTMLSRLGGAIRAMPDARFVVCIRNPFDTIASWMADAPGAPVQQRAEEWLALAQTILPHREKLKLVRYDDLVVRPRRVLGEVLAGWRPGRRTEPARAIEPRRPHGPLAERDREVIRTVCGGAARDLGLDFQ